MKDVLCSQSFPPLALVNARNFPLKALVSKNVNSKRRDSQDVTALKTDINSKIKLEQGAFFQI